MNVIAHDAEGIEFKVIFRDPMPEHYYEKLVAARNYHSGSAMLGFGITSSLSTRRGGNSSRSARSLLMLMGKRICAHKFPLNATTCNQ